MEMGWDGENRAFLGGSYTIEGTYVENDDGVLGPLTADLELLRVGDVVVEETEQGFAFFLFETHDVRCVFQ